MRIGRHEKTLLQKVIASEPIPLYIDHVPNKDRFNYEFELVRWLEKVQSKGLITVRKRAFINSTEKGRAALNAIGAKVGDTK